MRTTAVAGTCVLALVAAIQAAEPNWPQWRGPDGQGVSAETSLPTTWNPTERVAWKTPVSGRAHSSPIVWGNRVFLTTAIEGAPIEGHQPLKHYINDKEWRHPEAVAGDRRHTFQVIALDASDGKILWTSTAYEGPVYDDRHRKSSYAAHTRPPMARWCTRTSAPRDCMRIDSTARWPGAPGSASWGDERRHRHVGRTLRPPRDRPGGRRQRRGFLHRGARQGVRKRGVAGPPAGYLHFVGHARPLAGTGDQAQLVTGGQRSTSCPTTRAPDASCGASAAFRTTRSLRLSSPAIW